MREGRPPPAARAGALGRAWGASLCRRSRVFPRGARGLSRTTQGYKLRTSVHSPLGLTHGVNLIPKSGMKRRCRPVVQTACVLASTAALSGIAGEARAQCVDEELKEELVGGRHVRGVQ